MATRVLLAVDESPASLAAVRALRAAGYAPVVAAPDVGVYAARSRAAAAVVQVPDPKEDAEAFAGALARVDAAAVLPATEGSLRALTGRESHFRAVVGTNPQGLLDRATDKTLLAELARTAGLATPRRDAGTFPAIVKPAASVLPGEGTTLRSFEVERVDDATELERAAARYGDVPFVVEEWIEGVLCAVGGVAWEGEVVCTVHQESPRIWPPGSGITAFAVTVPRDEDVDRGVRALLGELGWSGVFGVQFLRRGAAKHLIDLNPRIYGSIQLAIAAGQNLPALWADLLLGGKPDVRDEYRVGVGYRVEEDDVRAILHGRDLRGLLPRRRTTHAVFSWRDPAPLLATLAKLRR